MGSRPHAVTVVDVTMGFMLQDDASATSHSLVQLVNCACQADMGQTAKSVIVRRMGYAMKDCMEMGSASALRDGRESAVRSR